MWIKIKFYTGEKNDKVKLKGRKLWFEYYGWYFESMKFLESIFRFICICGL